MIGQLVIHGKTNEKTAIPELVELLEIEGSTITIDAIGATENIMNAIHDNGGEFVLQTMFLRSPFFDSSSPEVLEGWMNIVRKLKPREVMVYTLDRETPAEGLEKFSADEMRGLVKPLIEEGYTIQIRG